MKLKDFLDKLLDPVRTELSTDAWGQSSQTPVYRWWQDLIIFALGTLALAAIGVVISIAESTMNLVISVIEFLLN